MRTREDLCQQTWGKGELVAFAWQGERRDLAEGEQARQIVLAIERANALDRATTPVTSGSLFVREFLEKDMAKPAARVRVRFDQVRRLKTPGRSAGRIPGQLEGARLAGQRIAVGVCRRDGVGDPVLGIRDENAG